MTTALSFFLARLAALRIYSTAVRLLKKRYASSKLATVFPSFSSRWLIYDSRLNSMASRSR